MKIYFTASVSAKLEHAEISETYQSVVKKLESLGHTVYSDHVLKLQHKDIQTVDDKFRLQYYRDLLTKINSCDLVFAEMSYSSASIGHEVSLAIEKNKPVIIASKAGRIPQIFKALQQHDVYTIEYTNLDDLLDRLDDEIRQVKEGEDIRFNFLIPPTMVDYLEWVSKFRRIPKSVFIRDLIKGEMETDKEFKSR